MQNDASHDGSSAGLTLLAACRAAVALLGAAAAPAKQAPKPTIVTVNDFYFGPSSVTIKKGGSVKWVWSELNTYPHDVHLKKGPKGLKNKSSYSTKTTAVTEAHFQKTFATAGHLQVHLHDPPDGNEPDRHRQEVGPSVSFDPIDRRAFLGMGGMAFFCTLAGQQVRTDQGQINVSALADEVEVPPRVRAADANAAARPVTSRPRVPGQRRPDARILDRGRGAALEHRPHPPRPDDGGSRSRATPPSTPTATGRTAPTSSTPLAPATVPGPLIEAEVGDTVIVHFRNKLKAPVTMHPHGIFYANEMDGTYKGKWTDPGGFVQTNRTFTYVWEASEGTEGTWLYHDHGPMDPLPVFKGLHGPLIIRKPGEVRPEAEFFLAFHTWDPSITGLKNIYYCINGKAYAGNTPDARSEGRPARRLPRLRGRQLLPHLPPARAPLDRAGRDDRRQQDLRPGRLLPGRTHRGQPRPLVLPLPRLPAPAPGDERLVPRLLAGAVGASPARRWRSGRPRPRRGGGAGGLGGNTRVSIANYAWSNPAVHINLGEKVTWDWLGPDLAHSVTGISANDTRLGLRPRHRRAPTTAPATPSPCSSTNPAPTSSSASCTPSCGAR